MERKQQLEPLEFTETNSGPGCYAWGGTEQGWGGNG